MSILSVPMGRPAAPAPVGTPSDARGVDPAVAIVAAARRILFDAAQIDDHLDPALVPSVVLMNPPFSAMAHVAGRVQDAGFRHIVSALNRLAGSEALLGQGGGTGNRHDPDDSSRTWRIVTITSVARSRHPR